MIKKYPCPSCGSVDWVRIEDGYDKNGVKYGRCSECSFFPGALPIFKKHGALKPGEWKAAVDKANRTGKPVDI